MDLNVVRRKVYATRLSIRDIEQQLEHRRCDPELLLIFAQCYRGAKMIMDAITKLELRTGAK